MRTVQRGWSEIFREVCTDEKSMQDGFYLGALFMLEELMSLGDEDISEDGADGIIEGYYEEVEKYVDALIKKGESSG